MKIGVCWTGRWERGAAVFSAGAALLAPLWFSGCAAFFRPEPARQDFSFFVDAPSRPAAPDAPALAVRYFDSSPEFENDEFVYRTGETRWESDYYHVFSNAPSALLTLETRRWLDGSGIFREAGIPGLAPRGSWRLRGYVEELYGDFRDPNQPAAVLAIRFALYPPGDAASAQPVFDQSLRARRAFSPRTPQALADAWNQALRDILLRLERKLENSLPAQ